jgi:hypothetical protein
MQPDKCMVPPAGKDIPSSLSGLKQIGCKSVWAVHISPLIDQ